MPPTTEIFKRYQAATTPAERDRVVLEMQDRTKDGRISADNRMLLRRAIRAHYEAPAASGVDRMSQQKGLTTWTSGMYRDVQNMRRTGSIQSVNPWDNGLIRPDALRRKAARQVNERIATYLQRRALRAPITPRDLQVPRVLMRGIHGPLAAALKKQRFLVDDGYIAFTRFASTASQFALRDGIVSRFALRDGIVLILRVSDVPQGTPWLWFEGMKENEFGQFYGQLYGGREDRSTRRRRFGDRQSDTASSMIEEGEVLLPPGRLILAKRVTGQQKTQLGLRGHRHVWEVQYLPDLQARSLGGHRIMLKAGRPST